MRRSRTHTSRTKQQPLSQLSRLSQLSKHRHALKVAAVVAFSSALAGPIAPSTAAPTDSYMPSGPTQSGQTISTAGLWVAQTPAAPDYPTLSANSTGDSVSRLQATLKLLGFYAGDVNGTYTQATQDAVSRFQSASGLTADGMTGPATWRKLLPTPDDIENVAVNPPPVAITAPTPSTAMPIPRPEPATAPSVATQPTEQPTTTQPATAQPAPSGQPPVLRPDAEGPTVAQLQRELQELNYYSGNIDGGYGEQTQAAVRTFQRDHKLVVDAIVGPSTWDALASERAAIMAEPAASNGEPPTLRPDAEGPAVAQLQRELQELGYYRGNIDGGYGEQTQAAVRTFQRDHKLVVDAIVGPSTWDALSQALDR